MRSMYRLLGVPVFGPMPNGDTGNGYIPADYRAVSIGGNCQPVDAPDQVRLESEI